MSVFSNIPLLRGERWIDSWSVNYSGPGGAGGDKLLVSNLRLLIEYPSHLSSLPPQAQPLFATFGGKDYLVFPKRVIAKMELVKGAMGTRSMVLTLTDGQRHDFGRGAMSADALIDAVREGWTSGDLPVKDAAALVQADASTTRPMFMDENGNFVFTDDLRAVTVVLGTVWMLVFGALCGLMIWLLAVPDGSSRTGTAVGFAIFLVPFFLAFRSVFHRSSVRVNTGARTIERTSSWFGSPRVVDSHGFGEARKLVSVTRTHRGNRSRREWKTYEVSLVLQDESEMELCDEVDRVGVAEMMKAVGELLRIEPVLPPEKG